MSVISIIHILHWKVNYVLLFTFFITSSILETPILICILCLTFRNLSSFVPEVLSISSSSLLSSFSPCSVLTEVDILHTIHPVLWAVLPLLGSQFFTRSFYLGDNDTDPLKRRKLCFEKKSILWVGIGLCSAKFEQKNMVQD